MSSSFSKFLLLGQTQELDKINGEKNKNEEGKKTRRGEKMRWLKEEKKR